MNEVWSMAEDKEHDRGLAEAVDMVLKPVLPRQLSEAGLLVFWRDGIEPGRREGLACILSMCPNPDCECDLVYIDGFVIDGGATTVFWDQEGVHLEHAAGTGRGRITLAKIRAVVRWGLRAQHGAPSAVHAAVFGGPRARQQPAARRPGADGPAGPLSTSDGLPVDAGATTGTL